MTISPGKGKYIGRHFDKIHYELTNLWALIDQLDDETASGLMCEMEKGALGPMRRLRKHLAISYDGNEKTDAD